ncbi:MAG: TolB family protein, partial [Pyrinomonadaceae bacterium]
MKQAFRSLCAISALMLIAGALSFVQAQTPTATPDAFVAQVTSSTAGVLSNPFASFAGDISGDGRFVVIESNGDIATEKTPTRNNADGNREIFLLDYAQRRIFQITNTTNTQKLPASPTPTPTPSASPTPAPAPTPADYTNVDVEVSNNRPVLSANARWIVFSSNASTPGNFDGNANRAALLADGNQEVFLYFIPAVTSIDLSSGAEAPFVDLTTGTFTRITNTAASRVPTPGNANIAPWVADDNRDATVNDSASVVSFVSNRNLTGNNADGNPEIFVYNRTADTTTQITNTPAGTLLAPIFNSNPSLSGSGAVLAFVSNANISIGGTSSNADGNAEIYLASTSAVTRQVTKTKTDTTFATVNIFSFGRRISRDGNFLAFESLADDPKADGSIKPVYGIFVYNIALDTFAQVGPRSTTGDILHFPTFTDYDSSLNPHSVVFASILNFRADGTIPEAGKESEGLNNTSGAPQVFLAPIPVASTGPFTRLTNIPSGAAILGIRPFLSETRGRLSFSLGSRELGGGNPDGSTEVYYLLSRAGTDVTATIALFTGASERPVVTPSPTPPAVAGLAPGMLGIMRSTTALAPSTQNAGSASQSLRRPPLPVELNGVSVSVN